MKIPLQTVIAGLLCLAVLTNPALAQDWVDESNKHTEVVLNAQLKFQPEAGTELGLDEYDEMVFDLGPDLFERTTAEDRILVGMTQEWLRTAEHPKVIQDLEILRQALEDGIHSAELEHKYMLPYFNLSQNLFFGFRALLDPRTDPERYPAALVRLKKYTGSADGYQPLTELAIARTTERIAGPIQR